MKFLCQIVFQLLGKITEPRNIGHIDLDLFLCQSSGHMEVIIQVWHFSIQKSLYYKAKITELWNIDHIDDLDIFWGQSSGHIEVII